MEQLDFNELFILMGEFSVKTFQDADSINHLNKLKDEADEAIREPRDKYEFADCFLALMAASYKAGFTPDIILNACQIKLDVLKQRKWEKLSNGSYQHIK